MSKNPTYVAPIVEWYAEKGYGFVEHEGKRLILHAHDFVAVNRRIQVGDEISFILGTDNDSRRCAKNARHAGRSLNLIHILLLAVLLVAPGLAIARYGKSHDLRILLGSAAIVIVLTYLMYWEDKRRAQAASWRVPDNTLHIMELIGGWPAAYLAQRQLRHKQGKFSYQLTFWLIVGLYQFVAVDYFLGWPMLTLAKQSVVQVMKRK